MKYFKVPQAAKRWCFPNKNQRNLFDIKTHISKHQKKDGEISTGNAFRIMLAESCKWKRRLHKTVHYSQVLGQSFESDNIESQKAVVLSC